MTNDRIYSLSVRRQSIVDRADLKKMSSREEKILRQETLEAEVSLVAS